MNAELIIVGDFDPGNESHAATNNAIEHCSRSQGLQIEHRWLGTAEVNQASGLDQVRSAGGLWIAPASPYRSMDGALRAIRTGREEGIPVLGTCGGFQHIIIEYARNVLGIPEAQHEETAPDATTLIISRLTCSLVGRTMTIRFEPDSVVGRAYGKATAQERYYCNFGLNPAYEQRFRNGLLRAVASDAEGVVRAVELGGHEFFVGTLFLPQLNSSAAAPHLLISAFLRACAARRLSPAI